MSQTPVIDPLIDPFGEAIEPAELDAAILAGSFHEAAQRVAHDMYNRMPNAFESYELETRLWELVERLVILDVSALQSPSAEEAQQLRNTEAIEWLQTNMKEPTRPSGLQPLRWLYTQQKSAKTRNGENLITELDEDAPLRQKRSVLPEDAKADEEMFAYVFQLCMMGNYVAARDVALETGNYTLWGALNAFTKSSGSTNSSTSNSTGSTPLNSSGTDGSGNGYAPGSGSGTDSAEPGITEGVLEACLALSNSNTVSRYEKAVYALLSRNVAAVVPFCKTWESLLLVHLQAGASLSSFEACVQRDHRLVIQNEDWRRRLVVALIQDRLAGLAAPLIDELQDRTGLESVTLLEHPWLARVLLHMILVSQLAKGDLGGSGSTVVSCSAENTAASSPATGHIADDAQTDAAESGDHPGLPLALILLYGDYHVYDGVNKAARYARWPAYVRLVSPAGRQAIAWGRPMSRILDESGQLAQLAAARPYMASGSTQGSAQSHARNAPKHLTGFALDAEPAVIEALKVNFSLAESIGLIGDREVWEDGTTRADIPHSDLRLVYSLQWPMNAHMWPLAVASIKRAYLLFFRQGRRHGATKLFEQINVDFVCQQTLADVYVRRDGAGASAEDTAASNSKKRLFTQDVAQLKQCSDLADALAQLDAWATADRTSPQWRTTATKLVGAALDAVARSLKFGAPRSLQNADTATAALLAEIRQVYIPQIVYELFELLCEAESLGRGYARAGLEFAVRLADDELKLYELFDKSLMTTSLRQLALLA